MTNELTEGKKNDRGKLRFDLITPEMEEALAEILTHGATKYEDRNWEKGIKYSRIYAALRRHLNAWVRGNIFDRDSNLPHLSHAFCCLAFLITYDGRRMHLDWDDLHRYRESIISEIDRIKMRAKIDDDSMSE